MSFKKIPYQYVLNLVQSMIPMFHQRFYVVALTLLKLNLLVGFLWYQLEMVLEELWIASCKKK